MSRKIECLGDLIGYTLRNYDTVIFGSITYTVYAAHLGEVGGNNSKIFDDLGIPSRHAFASDSYGYTSNRGDWPEYKSGDYEAATRLVRKLYEKITGESGLVVNFEVSEHKDKNIKTVEIAKAGHRLEIVALIHKNGNHWLTNEPLYQEYGTIVDSIIKQFKDESSKQESIQADEH